MSKYTHLELDKDVPAPSGYYTPQKEVKLPYNGREVLYTVSQAVIESSCCGASDFSSVQVPGYILGWRVEKNNSGLPVSLIEPIADEIARDAIRKIIKNTEHIAMTEFW
ncbi:MAG: hypothetical protein A2Y90_01270 [Chloroflexi bacterium RBG_13_52_12]|nr:MAG: hypothetical protein A2Y90_01270 [Chloroflexi bacterium RBG_13_52_12]